MNKQERAKIGEMVAGQVSKQLALLHAKLDARSTPAIAAESAQPSWSNRHPLIAALLIGVVGSAFGGFIVAKWQAGKSADDDHLNLKVAAEVAKQLLPIQDRLTQVLQDVAKIKGHDGIAQSRPTLPSIQAQIRALEGQERPNEAEVLQAASALRSMDPQVAGYWNAVKSVINLQARARSHRAIDPQVVARMPSCVAMTGQVSHTKIEGRGTCIVKLSDVQLSNVTVAHAIVRLSGTIRLSNVTFVDCIFVVDVLDLPPPPAKLLMAEILAKSLQANAEFTVSAG